MNAQRIPLFPLPEVVLLPGTLLPLHIFESRYRAMVSDALEGERMIGMAMLETGWEGAREPLPVRAVGGAGEIVQAEQLPDGRYNIVLEGRFRFRVLEESPANPYRVARVEQLAPIPFSSVEEEERVCRLAAGLYGDLAGAMELPPLPEERLPAERLASELAIRLRYGAEQLQDLLESDSIAARFATMLPRMLDWQRRLNVLAPFRPKDLDVTRN